MPTELSVVVADDGAVSGELLNFGCTDAFGFVAFDAINRGLKASFCTGTGAAVRTTGAIGGGAGALLSTTRSIATFELFPSISIRI